MSIYDECEMCLDAGTGKDREYIITDEDEPYAVLCDKCYIEILEALLDELGKDGSSRGRFSRGYQYNYDKGLLKFNNEFYYRAKEDLKKIEQKIRNKKMKLRN